MKTRKKSAAKPAKKSAAKKSGVFTAEERAAMKEYVREKKAQARGADGEKELLARIAKLPPADRALAKKVHEIVKANAPELECKTWYGMPAYAKDGKTVCYFQDAHKFKARYATLGFSDKAHLDEGNLWPVVFALRQIGAKEEAFIIDLLRQALG